LIPPTDAEQVIERFCAGLVSLADNRAYAEASKKAIENVAANFLWSSKRVQVNQLLATAGITEPDGDTIEANTPY
jgi:hypothetical protein